MQDIERLRSSASVIAQSLADFGRGLRETELPNDAVSTERVLGAQAAERDAIKVGFFGSFFTQILNELN